MTTSTLTSCTDPTDSFVVEIRGGDETAQVNDSDPALISTWKAFGGPMAAAVSLAVEALQGLANKTYLGGRVDLITGIVTVYWTE